MNQKEREKKVVELYLAKESCANIAKKLKIERKSVYRILERNNISLRMSDKKSAFYVII